MSHFISIFAVFLSQLHEQLTNRFVSIRRNCNEFIINPQIQMRVLSEPESRTVDSAEIFLVTIQTKTECKFGSNTITTQQQILETHFYGIIRLTIVTDKSKGKMALFDKTEMFTAGL